MNDLSPTTASCKTVRLAANVNRLFQFGASVSLGVPALSSTWCVSLDVGVCATEFSSLERFRCAKSSSF